MSEHELEEIDELRHNVKIRGDVHPDLFNDLIKLPQSQRVTRLLSLALKGLLLSPSTGGSVGNQLRPSPEESRRAGAVRTSQTLQAKKKLTPATEPRVEPQKSSEVPALRNGASTAAAGTATATVLEPQSPSSAVPFKEDKVAVVVTPQPTVTADAVSLGQSLDLDSSDLDFLTDPAGALG